MSISIVIPTYEYKGKACEILQTCLKSIELQSFKDYEVIISDHSTDDVVQNYLQNWNLPIKYFKNERMRGNSSVNMNDGIRKSNNDIIKIMHMDDWFCNSNALKLIHEATLNEPHKKWGGVGFNHFYQEKNVISRYIMPHINNDIRTLLGCPSVSFFINNKKNLDLFDENLIIINDSDMHFRLGKKYGDPILINEYCVTIRMHDLQVSNHVSNEKHEKEIEYYRKKNFYA
jgi:glycosyltransferase involved in cell wall biosynthesis